jgi:hypothetical protein
MDTRKTKHGESWIVAYRKGDDALKLEPAPQTRGWMESLPGRFANRCLPLLIANQSGWFLLNDRAFEAEWKGGPDKASVRIRYPRGPGPCWASSHFGHGILTFSLPYLFRTSPGVDLLVRGPTNLPKDGIAALEGIVETDWAVAPFTMNWKFTRPKRRVRFEVDEPIAMIMPMMSGDIELFEPRLESMDTDSKLKESYLAWRTSRAEFTERSRSTPQGRSVWQKHYLLGTSPDGTTAPQHRLKLHLQQFQTTPAAKPPKD